MNLNKVSCPTRITFLGAANTARKYITAQCKGTLFRPSPRSVNCLTAILPTLSQLADDGIRTATAALIRQALYTISHKEVSDDELASHMRIMHATTVSLISAAKEIVLLVPLENVVVLGEFLHLWGTRPKDTRGRRTRPVTGTNLITIHSNLSPQPFKRNRRLVRADDVLLLGPVHDVHPATIREIRDRFHFQVGVLIERGYHSLVRITSRELRTQLEPLLHHMLEQGVQNNYRAPFILVPHHDLALQQLMSLVEVSTFGINKETRNQGSTLMQTSSLWDVRKLRKYSRPYLLTDVAHGAGIRSLPLDEYERIICKSGRSLLTVRELIFYLVYHEMKLNTYRLAAAAQRYGDWYVPYISFNPRHGEGRAELWFTTKDNFNRWKPAPKKNWRKKLHQRILQPSKLWRAVPSCAERISAREDPSLTTG
jgi:hypothetical protein